MADAAKATPPPLLLLLPPPRATGSARSLGDWRRLVVGGMESAVATVSVLSVAKRIDALYEAVRGAKQYPRFDRARRRSG
jgi:hypothetical protein